MPGEARTTTAERREPAEPSPRPVRDELRRMASDAAYAWRLASGKVHLPPPTPPQGPDPYGNPDPEWLRIDWSERRHQVDVVGAGANYIEMGEGPPLLFVHGLSGAWQNWLENIPHFARTHRVIAVDLPGFGAQPDAALGDLDPCLRPLPARLLRAARESGRCSLVGNSMGGFIATEVAINEPERVEDLVLVSAAGITWARARREPAAMIARVGRAAAPLALRFHMQGIQRPRLRKALLPGRLLRSPRHTPGDALGEHRACPQEPGLLDAMTTSGRLRHPTSPRGDRACPP